MCHFNIYWSLYHAMIRSAFFEDVAILIPKIAMNHFGKTLVMGEFYSVYSFFHTPPTHLHLLVVNPNPHF